MQALRNSSHKIRSEAQALRNESQEHKDESQALIDNPQVLKNKSSLIKDKIKSEEVLEKNKIIDWVNQTAKIRADYLINVNEIVMMMNKLNEDSSSNVYDKPDTNKKDSEPDIINDKPDTKKKDTKVKDKTDTKKKDAKNKDGKPNTKVKDKPGTKVKDKEDIESSPSKNEPQKTLINGELAKTLDHIKKIFKCFFCKNL